VEVKYAIIKGLQVLWQWTL